MSWFREILELQHETNDASEFMESMKMDFFSDLVFVFTPKGEVIELPAGRFRWILLIGFIQRSVTVRLAPKSIAESFR